MKVYVMPSSDDMLHFAVDGDPVKDHCEYDADAEAVVLNALGDVLVRLSAEYVDGGWQITAEVPEGFEVVVTKPSSS